MNFYQKQFFTAIAANAFFLMPFCHSAAPTFNQVSVVREPHHAREKPHHTQEECHHTREEGEEKYEQDVNSALQNAIIALNPSRVREALEQKANPNYTPQPHTPTAIESFLKKYWYTNEPALINDTVRGLLLSSLIRATLYAVPTTLI